MDAKVSLQLVLLKLRHGLDFGDVIINGCTNSYDESVQLESKLDMMNLDLSDPATVSKFIYATGLNIEQDFFHLLRDNNLSGIYIENKLKPNRYFSNYGIEHTCEHGNEDVYNKLKGSLNKYKFIWSEFCIKTNPDENYDVILIKIFFLLCLSSFFVLSKFLLYFKDQAR